MQSLKGKLKRMYPMIKEGSTSKKRGMKENRTKSNMRKMERKENLRLPKSVFSSS